MPGTGITGEKGFKRLHYEKAKLGVVWVGDDGVSFRESPWPDLWAILAEMSNDYPQLRTLQIEEVRLMSTDFREPRDIDDIRWTE